VKAYAAAGTYTVTLQVSNASGSDTESKQVTVSPAGVAPTASFSWSPASPLPGQTVQFTDTSTGGPTAWSWDFGDGTFSAAQNPAKVYGGAATLTVRLTVTNAFGSGTTTRQVTIAAANRAPTAVPDAYSVASGATLSVSSPGVLANDTDPDGDSLTASLVSPPSGGTFGLQPSGAFAYTPPAGFVGTSFFTYRAVDSKGAASNVATVTITVTPSEAERVVPIVLDAFGVGGSRFRSELVLANRGTAASTVELTYTAATALNGTGSGTVSEALGAGRQLVVDDALAYLRSKGLAIPQAAAGASQGGTVRVRFLGLSSPEAGAAFARTTALLPEGRAGVAYPAVTPGEWLTPEGQHVFGLRETAEARSNLALVNLSSTADVGLRVTLQSGAAGDRRTFVLPETIWLAPLQWTQLGSVLARAGFTNGWALVERASGSGPFYAYGVFNDFGTNDGSFIDPIPVASGVPARTVPVILELGIYSTQLILTNPTASTVAVELGYVESLSAAGVARRTGTDLLQPREQKMVEAIPHLRALGVDVGAPGGSYAGSVVASFFQSGVPVNGFAGARTKSPGQPQGSYGVYYSGLGAGQMAPSEAWVYGLKQDGDSRTNVAVAHGEPGGGPIVVQAEVFDGQTGAKAGGTGNVTLKAGQWFQWNQLLGSFGLRQGYARVFRVSGTSPFLAYGVVNDGGTARPGTNDGSYVPMLPSR
jgi:PKD repeat protein